MARVGWIFASIAVATVLTLALILPLGAQRQMPVPAAQLAAAEPAATAPAGGAPGESPPAEPFSAEPFSAEPFSADPFVAAALADGAAARVDPRLLKQLLADDGSGRFDVIVTLPDQPELAGLAPGAVVRHLQEHARSSQAPLLAALAALGADGHVARVQPFWIFNGLALQADRQALLALAARDDVALIRADAAVATLPDFAPLPPGAEAPGLAPGAPASGLWNLTAIRAELARSAFGVSGRGVVIGNIGSGVDWRHPAVIRQYRGYNPSGPPDHFGNWADLTGSGWGEPTDQHGSGTHTLGTTLGSDIGVAPGARWIAVQVFHPSGYALESWLHGGFQWMLAPGGDPARAPDIVTLGWYLADPASPLFRPDVVALRAAGIFAVYGTGDYGPNPGTLVVPGSYPEAFSVGTLDPQDETTNFSGRGPTAWGQIRPDVAAPGAYISSSLPGGRYAAVSASPTGPPHAAGIAALLLEVDPQLGPDALAGLLRTTAIPPGPGEPSNEWGWGRVDAYGAVAALRAHASVRGTVRGPSGPLGGARLQAVDLNNQLQARLLAGPDGRYALLLAPGLYEVTVSAFAHLTRSFPLRVSDGLSLTVDIALEALPAGAVRGRLVEAGLGLPVSGTVHAAGTPVTATTDAAGYFRLTLPEGRYVLQTRALGYRPAASSPLSVTAGVTLTQDFTLERTSRILLVDASAWYYGTDARFFRAALDGLSVSYDEQAVKILPRDVPDLARLRGYDLVIWSSPFGSPGVIDAGEALSGFLELGGALLMTGQDVGYWDGGLNGYISARYYRDKLRAAAMQDDVITRTVTALDLEPFAGLTVTLNGADSAQNQYFPDIVRTVDRDAGAAVATYADFGGAALRANVCRPYRTLYLAFGLEGVTGAAARRALLERALDWLGTPQPARGVELRSGWEPLVGPPGAHLVRTVRVRNIGRAADDIQLALQGADWPTELATTAFGLGSCAAGTTEMRVTVPAGASWDARDELTLVATTRGGVTAALALTTKAPAPVLYVDDDRFYEGDRAFRGALAAAGTPYDYWLVGWDYFGGRGSPPTATLRLYPVVVWSTGYDWYDPLTRAEETKLSAYLAGGGRLLLSSQDVLGDRGLTPFTRGWLGVRSFIEALTATVAYGADAGPLGDQAGRYPLAYPFLNWSDALVPYDRAEPILTSERGYPAALALATGAGKTVFYGFPFEVLPEEARGAQMARALGWLSALGSSAITADVTNVIAGQEIRFTLDVRNDGLAELRDVQAVNALPATLEFVAGSLEGPGSYDPVRRRVTWSGTLPARSGVTIRYRARVASGVRDGETIANPLALAGAQRLPVTPAATLRVYAPDLASSTLAVEPRWLEPGGLLTATLRLRNAGLEAANAARVTTTLPLSLTLVPGTLRASSGTLAPLADGFSWRGVLAPGLPVTVTFVAQVPEEEYQTAYALHLVLDDRSGRLLSRSVLVEVGPYRVLAPVMVGR